MHPRVWRWRGHRCWLRRNRYRIECRWNLRPFTQLLAPAEQLAGVNPRCTGDLGGDCARLHRRCNNPFVPSLPATIAGDAARRPSTGAYSARAANGLHPRRGLVGTQPFAIGIRIVKKGRHDAPVATAIISAKRFRLQRSRFKSTPPVRPLRRSQVRAKGSTLRHAPAHSCIQHTV